MRLDILIIGGVLDELERMFPGKFYMEMRRLGEPRMNLFIDSRTKWQGPCGFVLFFEDDDVLCLKNANGIFGRFSLHDVGFVNKLGEMLLTLTGGRDD